MLRRSGLTGRQGIIIRKIKVLSATALVAGGSIAVVPASPSLAGTEKVNDEVEQYAAENPEKVAGLVMDSDQQVRVQVTNPEDQQTAAAAGVPTVMVSYGEKALLNKQESISAELMKTPGVLSIGVNSVRDAIEIGYDPATENTPAIVNLRNKYMEDRAVWFQPEEPLADATSSVGGWATSRCTSGFNAVAGGKTVMLWAGHCVGGLWTVHSNAQGEIGVGISNKSGNNGNDAGLLDFYRNVSTPASISDRRGGYISIKALNYRKILDQAVCKYGVTTGQTCGNIVKLAAKIRVGSTWRVGLLGTTACIEGGDSGGPLITGRAAVGIASAGPADNPDGTPKLDCGYNTVRAHTYDRHGKMFSYFVDAASALRGYSGTLKTAP